MVCIISKKIQMGGISNDKKRKTIIITGPLCEVALWSKEDEYNLNWIIGDYERALQTAISSVWEGRFKMIVDWLKSLKERMKGE